MAMAAERSEIADRRAPSGVVIFVSQVIGWSGLRRLP
jgi:hypothetical protein